jgi:hypothetical protein
MDVALSLGGLRPHGDANMLFGRDPDGVALGFEGSGCASLPDSSIRPGLVHAEKMEATEHDREKGGCGMPVLGVVVCAGVSAGVASVLSVAGGAEHRVCVRQ